VALRVAPHRHHLHQYSVFGVAALVIATLNLLRPSLVLLAAGLAVACLGVVLYNIVLSSLAIGLLLLKLRASANLSQTEGNRRRAPRKSTALAVRHGFIEQNVRHRQRQDQRAA